MKFVDTSWVYVGNIAFSSGTVLNTSIAIDAGGTPYVVYQDGADTDKATVMKYNGTSWVTVGSAGFSAGPASGYQWIAIAPDGTPYVVFTDDANGGKASVMQYNGTRWVNVGAAGFSAGTIGQPSIAIDNSGKPYVAYQDCSNGYKSTVMTYDGSWTAVGTPAFSAGAAVGTSIALNSSGTPYVIFLDSAHYEKATVMAFGSPAVVMNVSNISSALDIYPNPSTGTFTLHLSSLQNETAKVTITNILGEKVQQFTTATNADTQVLMDNVPGIYFVTAVTSIGKMCSKLELWQH